MLLKDAVDIAVYWPAKLAELLGFTLYKRAK